MFRFGRNGFKSSYNCCKPNQDLGILWWCECESFRKEHIEMWTYFLLSKKKLKLPIHECVRVL